MLDVEAPRSSSLDTEQERREARKKAGELYLESVLAAAKKGRDPYKADAAARRKPVQRSQVDPDMELVGEVVKGAETYVVGAVYAVAAAVSVPLLYVSLFSQAQQALHCQLLAMHGLPDHALTTPFPPSAVTAPRPSLYLLAECRLNHHACCRALCSLCTRQHCRPSYTCCPPPCCSG